MASDTRRGPRSPSRSLGARIADARKACGLNRNQLARQLGTSWALVDRWEKDRTVPSVTSLNRLAEVLRVGVDQLLGTSSSASPVHEEVFAEYLTSYAPRDLSDGEQRWLQSAPVGPGQLTTEDYAEMLQLLRRTSRGSRADSGTHGKVVDFTNGSDRPTTRDDR